jgi:hypothetical protein
MAATPAVGLSVGRSVRLLLCFACTDIPGFSLNEIHDQDFCSLLDMYVFKIGASSSKREGSVFLCSRYVCCNVVSARVYPCCHGVQVSMYSMHPLSLHIPSNIYTRYTEVFYQCRLVQQVIYSILFYIIYYSTDVTDSPSYVQRVFLNLFI